MMSNAAFQTVSPVQSGKGLEPITAVTRSKAGEVFIIYTRKNVGREENLEILHESFMRWAGWNIM